MYVEMKGRLGNQFFIYAFSRYISKLTGDEEFVFDFSFIDRKRDELKETTWEDNLQYFHVKPYKKISCAHRAALDCSTIRQRIFLYRYWLQKRICSKSADERYALERKMAGRLNQYGIYLAQDRYIEMKPTNSKNIIVTGHFESPQYFQFLRKELLEEFTPQYAPLPENKKLYDSIRNSESVCVTIRRGDFLRIEAYKKEFFVCDYQYFKSAMDQLKIKVPNCKFFIFSDDVEWVKENYHFEYPVIYERGCDPIWEKLRLMYSCKHFIISNSTFSWWAQNLSRNEEKIVIAPSRWYNLKKASDLLEEHFIKIGV